MVVETFELVSQRVRQVCIYFTIPESNGVDHQTNVGEVCVFMDPGFKRHPLIAALNFRGAWSTILCQVRPTPTHDLWLSREAVPVFSARFQINTSVSGPAVSRCRVGRKRHKIIRRGYGWWIISSDRNHREAAVCPRWQ